MRTLKPIAIKEGIKNRNAKFDNIFADVVKKNGRASEFLLISKYSISEPGMIKQAPFGLELISKGKLPLSIDKMDDLREMDSIFSLSKKTGSEEKTKSKEKPPEIKENNSDNQEAEK